MEAEKKLSCDEFPSESTSSKSDIVNRCNKPKPRNEIKEDADIHPPCSIIPSSSGTSTSSVSTGYFNPQCKLHSSARRPPNIGYELAIAKSVLQQYSTLSGDNLFDHLSDIIKRVVDERPPNIIDFFEEFSRNVREQKFHLPERFPPDTIYEEGRSYKVAKRMLLSMKLANREDRQDILSGADEISMESLNSSTKVDLPQEIRDVEKLFLTFNDRVQQLQFYWNQCGFSISLDDIFQLACSMNRLQTHPSITQCRFWGIVNGLKSSYYIVEATLTREEVGVRLEQMENEMRGNQVPRLPIKKKVMTPPSDIGPELIPGVNGWENYPKEELAGMKPAADPLPTIEKVETYDIPPELVGQGLNRFSYFVVNALSDNWIELPIVTPKQIVVSRYINQFLTGDLEAEITTYPCFPGKEKHYLRAIIARVTAGTYIAPSGLYRKMTKKETRMWEGIDNDEEEEEDEDDDNLMNESEEEIEELDNDMILLRNEKYVPQLLETMSPLSQWVHIRPNILKQGRIVWFDEEKARRVREKELARLLRLETIEKVEEGEEEESDEEDEGEEEELLEELNLPEIGPPILNPCHLDTTQEFTIPWISRYTSKYTNKNERVLVMRSNIWPGAYTFTFENMCESVYMGWGHKYTTRNMPFKHLAPILDEYPHGSLNFIEANDPTVAEEEAYRLLQLRRQMHDTVDEMDEFQEEMPNEFE